MKTILIVVAVVFVLWFLLGVGAAAISALSKSGRKRQRATGMLLLSEIPKGAFGVLLLVFAAFKLDDAEKANRMVAEHTAETVELLKTLSQQRDPMLSSGRFGDSRTLEIWRTGLVERGYSEPAAQIL